MLNKICPLSVKNQHSTLKLNALRGDYGPHTRPKTEAICKSKIIIERTCSVTGIEHHCFARSNCKWKCSRRPEWVHFSTTLSTGQCDVFGSCTYIIKRYISHNN